MGKTILPAVKILEQCFRSQKFVQIAAHRQLAAIRANAGAGIADAALPFDSRTIG